MHTTTQNKSTPIIPLVPAADDIIKLVWIERCQQWYRVSGKPISKSNYERLWGITITMNEPIDFNGKIVKFIRPGEAIN